jgi:O-acetyl-ADP-ribose deacetylase (regulator of RNase III)
MTVKPEVILGDITTLDVDVIVNAANPSLAAGAWTAQSIVQPGRSSLPLVRSSGNNKGAPGACGDYDRGSAAGQRGDPCRRAGLARRASGG